MFFTFLTSCDLSHATTFTYTGREQDAEWRSKSLERINKIRKSELNIEIVDSSGKPVSGAQVKATMLRHAFAFGSAVTGYNLTVNNDDGRRYRDIVAQCFNKVVFENDLKWGEWDKSKNRDKGAFYNIDNTFDALNWLRNHHIQVRGHYVAWAPLAADKGTLANAESHKTDFRNVLIMHADEEVHKVGDLVSEWDVLNHPVSFDTKTIRDLAGNDIYDVMFRKVKDWNPKATRYINEGLILTDSGKNKANNNYYQLISAMLNRNVPIQGIGFMGHFFAEKDLTSPQRLLDILDKYSKFGLPLQVTEFDVRYGTPGKYGEFIKLTPEQEQLQADYTRDFLITMYSHPSVIGVVMWGFWEGQDWYPSAALFRKDWSIKPNGKVWLDLVFNKWWTKVAGTTDKNGKFSTHGFLGSYEIEVSYKGKIKILSDVNLKAPNTNVRITL